MPFGPEGPFVLWPPKRGRCPYHLGRLRALVTAMARLDLPFAQASSARSHPVPAHRVSDLQDLKNDRLSV